MAMKNVLKQPEKNAQGGPGEKGWACYCCGKEGHLKQDCPQASKPPRLHVPSAKDHTGRETAPRGVGLRGRTLKTIRLKVPGGPHTSSRPNYTRGTPGISNCGGQSLDFLLDTGTTYSVLTEAPGLLSS